MKNILYVALLCACSYGVNAQYSLEFKPMSGPRGATVITIAVQNSKVVFASVANDGIYKTSDAGSTWVKIQKGLYRKNSYATAMVFSPDGMLYAIIDNELYRLYPEDQEWDKTIYKFKDQQTLLYCNKNGTVYVLSGRYEPVLQFSKDKGNSLTNINTNELKDINQIIVSEGNHNYILGEDTNYEGAIYRFNEDGSDLKKIAAVNTFTASIYFDPKGYLFYNNGFDGFFRWNSDGTGKVNIRLPGTSYYLSSLHMANDKSGNLHLFNGSDEFISSNNGSTWKLQASKVGIYLYDDSKLFYYGDTIIISNYYNCVEQPLIYSFDQCNTIIDFTDIWTYPNIQSFGIMDNDYLYTQVCDNKFYISKDQGNEWVLLKDKLTQANILSLCANSKNRLFGVSNKVKYSDDFGQTWQTLRIFSDKYSSVYSDNKSFMVLSTLDSAHVSTDGGITWKYFPFFNHFQALNIMSSKVGRIIMPDYNEILLSEDFGNTWKNIEIPTLGSYEVKYLNPGGDIYLYGDSYLLGHYGIFKLPYKDTTPVYLTNENFDFIIGTSTGILYGLDNYYNTIKVSLDDGKTWKYVSSNLFGKTRISQVKIDNDQHMIIALDNDVLFRSTTPVSMINDIKSIVKTTAGQLELYPSPVRGNIHIRLSSENSNVRQIKICNMMGELVMLKNWDIQSTDIEISVEGLIPGAYFCELQDHNFKSLGKSRFIKL